MRRPDKGFNILKGEVRLDLGTLPLLGRIEDKFFTDYILNRIIEIAKNLVREYRERLLILRMRRNDGFLIVNQLFSSY